LTIVLAIFILSFDNPDDFSSASDMLSKNRTLKNRTLVIVTGNPRGGELAWKSLYKNVLDVNQADLAVFFGTSKNRTSSLYDRAKYVWEFEEYDDWGEAMDLINGTAWRDTLPYALPNHSTWIQGAKVNVTFTNRGSGAVVLMIRWFLMKEMEKLNIKNMYDRFVVTRSDHFYLCKHDLSLLDPGYVWVPQGEDYGGITDRYVIANSNDILKTLDVYPALLTSPYRYINHPEMKNFNPEELLKVRWTENGLMQRVKRFERVMFTCWVDGDSSRGFKTKKRTREGVKLKYETEYKLSKATCAKEKKGLSLNRFLIRLCIGFGFFRVVENLCNSTFAIGWRKNNLAKRQRE